MNTYIFITNFYKTRNSRDTMTTSVRSDEIFVPTYLLFIIIITMARAFGFFVRNNCPGNNTCHTTHQVSHRLKRFSTGYRN